METSFLIVRYGCISSRCVTLAKKGVARNTGPSFVEMKRFVLRMSEDIGTRGLEHKIQEEVQAVSAVISAKDGQPVDLKTPVCSATLNIICNIVFGIRYEYDDPELLKQIQVLDDFFKSDGTTSLANFMPWLTVLPSERQKFDQLINAIEKVHSISKRHLREHEATYDPNNIRDLCDFYIKVRGDELSPHLTEENLLVTLLDLWAAGTDTVTCTILWGLVFLVNYPRVQRQCQSEIDKVAEDGRMVKLADRDRLPYVQATIMEILRCGNTTSATLGHTVNKSTTFRGYTIPHDAFILGGLRSANLDPRHWEHPGEFRPERFLDEEGKVKQPRAFVPFSLGPRICPGERLAYIELFLFLANLLQKFHFHCVGDKLPSLEGIQSFTLQPQPFQVKAVARKRC